MTDTPDHSPDARGEGDLQIAREAAAHRWRANDHIAGLFLAGKCDHRPEVQSVLRVLAARQRRDTGSVPDGYMLVPREASYKMLAAAQSAKIASTSCTMVDWIEPASQKDFEDLGQKWPDFVYDRNAIVQEETREILLKTWWSAMVEAASPTPAVAGAVETRIEEISAKAYQVIGSLADAAGLFDHPQVIRALDYFGHEEWRQEGKEILPFAISPPLSVDTADNAPPPPSDPDLERLRAPEDDLLWLRSEIIGLCEDTEDKCSAAMQKNEDGEVAYHFYRGRAYEAKGIRRAIAEVVRCRLADRARHTRSAQST